MSNLNNLDWKIKIVLYTHSDYSDLWSPFLGRLKKFIGKFQLITFCDKNVDGFWHNVIQYDNKLSYTERLAQCFSFINDEPVLFIHEDMVLFDNVNIEVLSRFCNHVKDRRADFIKLIKVSPFTKLSFDENLVTAPDCVSFSVQPTIGMASTLNSLFKNSSPNSIWNFEQEAPRICRQLGLNKCFMSNVDGEPLRGMYHYDSFIFPYIATSIVKGKWNISEYSEELDILLSEYNIDKNIRGIR